MQLVVSDRNGRAVADVEVDKQRLGVCGIDVVPKRSQHAGDIRRAAGAAKPALTNRFDVIIDMVESQRFWMDLQRVHVEKVFTVQRHAAQHGVI
ncbi:hypothetical protein D3C80_1969570 [compost metagenome]